MAAGPGAIRSGPRREVGLPGRDVMGKHAVNRRPLTLIGGLAVLGLAATLAVTTPSAVGAQTRGHHEEFKVVADHLNNPRGLSPAPGGGLYLAEAGSGGEPMCGWRRARADLRRADRVV